MKLFQRLLLVALLVCNMPFAFAQTKPCVFCEIASGRIQQSQVIYRDSLVLAFLSHGPDNPGHMLVIPVAHATYFTDIPDATICQMMQLTRRLTAAIKKTDVKAEGFSIKTNVGKVAGQSVMHAHLHIIPRYVGETLNETHAIAPPEELDAVAEKIRNALEK